jgi:18S rRNA (guanine1575-N7)-methyltransferase
MVMSKPFVSRQRKQGSGGGTAGVYTHRSQPPPPSSSGSSGSSSSSDGRGASQSTPAPSFTRLGRAPAHCITACHHDAVLQAITFNAMRWKKHKRSDIETELLPSFPAAEHTHKWPEARVDAVEFYAADAERYTDANSGIQRELTAAALRLARSNGTGASASADPIWRRNALVVDIGCGSGLSGAVLAAEAGLRWVGLDLSLDMLQLVAPPAKGAVAASDMGHGLPLRPGSVDAAVSISAVQWLLQGPGSAARMARFFASLHAALRPAHGAMEHPAMQGAAMQQLRPACIHAALQCYIPTAEAAAALEAAARAAGFDSALVTDWPHLTPARKYFLLLSRRGGAAAAAAAESPGGRGSDLVEGCACPLGFYVGGTCSAQWLRQRKGGAAAAAQQPAAAEEAAGETDWELAQRRRAAEDAAVERYVFEHHTRQSRKVLRMVWGGACLHGLAGACLTPAVGGSTREGGGGSCCRVCGGVFQAAGSGGGGGGTGDAPACSCPHFKLLVGLESDANPCTGQLLLQVVGRADRAACLGLPESLFLPGAPARQQQPAGVEAGAPAAVASAAPPLLTGRAGAAAAAAASKQSGLAACEALANGCLTQALGGGGPPQLLGCELLSGFDCCAHIEQQKQSWEKQQQRQGACSDSNANSNPQSKKGKRLPQRPAAPYPIGFGPLLPPPAAHPAADGASLGWQQQHQASPNQRTSSPSSPPVPRCSVWSVASDDFLPHPVVCVEGLPPTAAALPAAVADALVTGARAASANVYGLLVVLGRDACCALAACYPAERGAGAGGAAPALLREVEGRLLGGAWS